MGNSSHRILSPFAARGEWLQQRKYPATLEAKDQNSGENTIYNGGYNNDSSYYTYTEQVNSDDLNSSNPSVEFFKITPDFDNVLRDISTSFDVDQTDDIYIDLNNEEVFFNHTIPSMPFDDFGVNKEKTVETQFGHLSEFEFQTLIKDVQLLQYYSDVYHSDINKVSASEQIHYWLDMAYMCVLQYLAEKYGYFQPGATVFIPSARSAMCHGDFWDHYEVRALTEIYNQILKEYHISFDPMVRKNVFWMNAIWIKENIPQSYYYQIITSRFMTQTSRTTHQTSASAYAN